LGAAGTDGRALAWLCLIRLPAIRRSHKKPAALGAAGSDRDGVWLA
jgi:hypothetical protein